MSNAAVAKRVFVPDRKARLEVALGEAKRRMIALLTLHAARDKSDPAFLAAMISRIKEVELDYDPFNANRFNMSADTRAVAGGRPPRIEVGGAILLVDKSPETILFFLLHELSHFLTPCSWPATRNDRAYASHPFSKVLNCLHRSSSIGVHHADLACARDRSEKTGSMD